MSDFDDTDMTAEEFLATREAGIPARVVTSRAEYEQSRTFDEPALRVTQDMADVVLDESNLVEPARYPSGISLKSAQPAP